MATLDRWFKRQPANHQQPISDGFAVQQPKWLLGQRRTLVQEIKQLVGVPSRYWDQLYLPALSNYAALVQELPASEAHHHRDRGGLLTHGLEVLRQALRLRRGTLLPPGATAEDLAMQQDIWTYAVSSLALLHDIGKPLTDIEVEHTTQNQTIIWSPWLGAMTEGRYRLKYRRDRRYELHGRVPLLLATKVLPHAGLAWLSANVEVFDAWSEALLPNTTNNLLHDMIVQADRFSVAENLTGNAAVVSISNTKSLHERLSTGLRYLIDTGALPLNRTGAAGWIADGDLWLVSKRCLDALREHLRDEGQQGVPTRNDILMDELQQHGLLTANGDRAIWSAEVALGDWSHTLSLLRLPVTKLWSNPDSAPDQGEAVITVEGETTSQQSTQTKQETAVTSPVIEQPEPEETPEADSPFSQHKNSKATTTKATADEPHQTDGSFQEPHAGERFVAWLTDQIREGKQQLNAVHARLHTTKEGLLLVSPAVFKDYDREDWGSVQKRFLKMKLHTKHSNGTNIFIYRVTGERKRSVLKGILIEDPESKLDLKLPPANTALSLPDQKPKENHDG